MKIITIEEHYTNQKVIDANAKYAPKRQLTPEQQKVAEFLRANMYPGAELMDIDKYRIPHMNQNGISMQILSYTSPVGDYVPADAAVDICKMANDLMAEDISKYPDRFRGMATLPMADPEAAANELERCVKQLGFVGVLLAGQYQGHWMDEPQFLPIFDKAAALDVPVYFHPAFINPIIQKYYYDSPSYSPIVAAELGSAAIGWHYDVGLQVIRMILSGIFDKYPNLKFVAGHWGDDMPAYLDRMTHILTTEETGLQRNIRDYYTSNVWITPSGIMSATSLYAFVKLMRPDHIIYSEDYPYIQPTNFEMFLADANLPEEVKEMIAHVHAEKLYKL